jgi:hypothetical protein
VEPGGHYVTHVLLQEGHVGPQGSGRPDRRCD